MIERLGDRLGDEGIRESLGVHAFDLGKAYARQGRVLRFAVGDERITATVQGNRRQPYQVLVYLDEWEGRLEPWGVCSCPVGQDCKHVSAVLFAARSQGRAVDRSAAGPLPGGPPSW